LVTSLFCFNVDTLQKCTTKLSILLFFILLYFILFFSYLFLFIQFNKHTSFFVVFHCVFLLLGSYDFFLLFKSLSLSLVLSCSLSLSLSLYECFSLLLLLQLI
jgi:hypothetical protein